MESFSNNANRSETSAENTENVAVKRRSFFPKPKIHYAALKYIGLAFMTVSQLAGFFAVRHTLASPLTEKDALLQFLEIMKNLGVLTMPLLLVAMTSAMIIGRENFGKVVVKNLLCTVIFYAVEILAFEYYIVPTVNLLLKDFAEIELNSAEILNEMLGEFSNVNIFIDLFLCSLLYLFFVYTPKRKKVSLSVWRTLTILPGAFIIASFVLNGLVKAGLLQMNFYIGALLPHKKIITYVFFFATMLFVKFKPKLYRRLSRHGNEYEEYLRTDTAALHHNLFLICLIAVLSLADFGLSFLPRIEVWGIGNSYYLFAAAPFLLWFDYRLEPKRRAANMLVPLYYTLNYTILTVLYLFFLF